MEKEAKETAEARTARAGCTALIALCSIALMFVAAAAAFITIGYLLQSNWLMALAGAAVVAVSFFLLNRLMRRTL